MERFVEKYSPIADLIAKTFGPDCEVVLHDLSVPQNSVVYTVNGYVTGRKVGQSFDHLVTQVLLSQNFLNDCSSNYSFYTPDGRLIKSSTALIRDDNKKVIGALCVNIDTTKITSLIQGLQNFLPQVSGMEGTVYSENDTVKANHIIEIAEDLMDKIIGGRDIESMKRNERIELIKFMDQKGLFLIRGVVDKVAARFGISKVTIYSYLDEIKADTAAEKSEKEI